MVERLTIKVDDAAKILGISRNLAYVLARQGELPGVIKLGQKRLVVSKVILLNRLSNQEIEQNYIPLRNKEQPMYKLFSAIFGIDSMKFKLINYQEVINLIKNVWLKQREWRVLELRYGFEDGKSRTLAEIGSDFCVSKERIRQIESSALRKLRQEKMLEDCIIKE